MTNILSQIQFFLDNKDLYSEEERETIKKGFIAQCDKKIRSGRIN